MAQSTIDTLVRKVDRLTTVLVLGSAGAALALGHSAVAFGLLLGGLFSLINFRLLARNARKMRDQVDPQAAARMSFASFGLRLPLMGVALIAALMFPEIISFAACAAGLFACQVVLVVAGLGLAKG